MHIVCDALSTHVDPNPMLTELVYVPLECKDLFVGQVFPLAQLIHGLTVELDGQRPFNPLVLVRKAEVN
jgi:hypothetical protein